MSDHDDLPDLAAQAREIESLRSQFADLYAHYEQREHELRTIGAHWLSKWTRYCDACSQPWPCRVVLDVVVPWMDDDPDPDEGVDDE